MTSIRQILVALGFILWIITAIIAVAAGNAANTIIDFIIGLLAVAGFASIILGLFISKIRKL